MIVQRVVMVAVAVALSVSVAATAQPVPAAGGSRESASELLSRVSPEAGATLTIAFRDAAPLSSAAAVLRGGPRVDAILTSRWKEMTAFFLVDRADDVDAAVAAHVAQFRHHAESLLAGGPRGEQAMSAADLNELLAFLAVNEPRMASMEMRGSARELLAAMERVTVEATFAARVAPVHRGALRPDSNGIGEAVSTAAPFSDPWKFTPSSGSVIYLLNQPAPDPAIISWMKWTDTSGFVAMHKGYEHDLVFDERIGTFVEPKAYYTNLPNAYADTPAFDEITYLTIGCYPCTVEAGRDYYVWMPLRILNTSHAATVGGLKPQLGSWAGTYDAGEWFDPFETGFCRDKTNASEPGNSSSRPWCVFADQTNRDVRFFQSYAASQPLYSRYPFDHRASTGWWYWEKAVSSDWKAQSCGTQYFGEYIRSTDTGGLPLFSRCDGTTLNVNWGIGRPGQSMPADQFAVRWSKQAWFNRGTHRFTVRHDGGVRLKINGVTRIDKWYDQGLTTSTADVVIDNGVHGVTLEYFDGSGNASASLDWAALAPPPPPPPATLLSEGAESGAPGWSFTSSGGSRWSIETSSASYSGARRFRLGSGAAYANWTNATLTSPSFNLGGRTSGSVTFSYKYDTEGYYDSFWAEVSNDGGGNWTMLTPRWSGLYPASGWARSSFILPSWAMGRQNVKIRFRFTSDGRTYRWGAAVDDIRVIAQ